MWELSFVELTDDGEHVVVRSTDLDDEHFLLPITDELRDAVAAPARPGRLDPLDDGPVTPREMQARIRAGESPEELARAAGLPLTKVERFAGPVLAERTHVADEAKAARISWHGAGEPTGSLSDVVTARLEAEGVRPDTVDWDAWRRDDGVWMVQVAYLSDGDRHTAEWSWDTGRRQLRPYGAAARGLSTLTPPAAEPAVEAAPSLAALRMVPTAAVATPSAAAPAEIDVRDETLARRAIDEPATRRAIDEPAARRAVDEDVTLPLADVTDAGPDVPTAQPAAAEAAPDAKDRPRKAGRRAARRETKRASLPSWDDIMFGVNPEH